MNAQLLGLTKRFMASTIDLDALIARADFDETDSNAGASQGGSAKDRLEARDLQLGEYLFSVLRKPDFQRETNEWDVYKIIDLIRCFLAGDVIPAVILWRAKTGLMYVIDGSHRLSALAAWVNDDYGEGAISKLFYDGIIQQEQQDLGQEVRVAINKAIGSYADHRLALSHPDKVKEQVVNQSRALAIQTIPMQIVRGDSVKAEASFRKINEQGVALDPTEKKILDGRKTPRGIAARAIIKGGKGYNYWSNFEADAQTKLKDSAREISDLLYLPKYANPVKTLDLPIAGKVNASYSLTLVWDFIGIVHPPAEKEEQDNKDGQLTLDFLTKCRKVAQRILSVHLSSLGLHPIVYTYSLNGRHKPASFYAIVDLVIKLNEKPNGFVTFSKVRQNLETLLIENDYIIPQIVRHNRGAHASYQNITKFYLACIEKLSSGMAIETVVTEIGKMTEFAFLSKPIAVIDAPSSPDFSAATKSYAYIKSALQGVPKCPFCHGYLHVNGITTDHIKDVSEGGQANAANAQPSHPYCNSTLKSILASES
ncbi:MAG: hypothetical protein JWQ71_2558 [Pedosphaera sp.]|nr:hypothetical protein [Pedosphaera sp.]